MSRCDRRWLESKSYKAVVFDLLTLNARRVIHRRHGPHTEDTCPVF